MSLKTLIELMTTGVSGAELVTGVPLMASRTDSPLVNRPTPCAENRDAAADLR